MTGEISITKYLLERLAQLGLKTIQGVPGDFSMPILDVIDDHHKIRWVGNANELNAAYSADGYARCAAQPTASAQDKSGKGHRISAVCTTFGVGELSAINGVAGSYAEALPVVHLVGTPSTELQSHHALLHHTLGNGSFDVFMKMSKPISVAQLAIADHKNDMQGAAKALDEVLAKCVREARPVYIALPTDLVNKTVSSAALSTPLDVSYPKNDERTEQAALKDVVSRIDAAKDPIIIIDACVLRHGAVKQALELIDESGCVWLSTPLGTTAIESTHPQYGGVYIGPNSLPLINERVDKADLILWLGSLKSDFNVGGVNYDADRSNIIEFHSKRTEVGYATYADIGMHGLLPLVAKHMSSAKEQRRKLHGLPKPENKLPTREEEGEAATESPDVISQAYLWKRIGSFFEPGDQIIAETGTSSFGLLDTVLPGGATRFHSQVLWGSIGWSVGATLGIALAAQEQGLGRVSCFVGDGSLQLTFQEITTMIREGLNPIIWVPVNEGYEIEREIHAPERAYNNVSRWDHEALLKGLYSKQPASVGGREEESRISHKLERERNIEMPTFWRVNNKQELDALLNNPQLKQSKGVQLVEIMMKRGDSPRALRAQAAATAKVNA